MTLCLIQLHFYYSVSCLVSKLLFVAYNGGVPAAHALIGVRGVFGESNPSCFRSCEKGRRWDDCQVVNDYNWGATTKGLQRTPSESMAGKTGRG